jgi:hypothetical protein
MEARRGCTEASADGKGALPGAFVDNVGWVQAGRIGTGSIDAVGQSRPLGAFRLLLFVSPGYLESAWRTPAAGRADAARRHPLPLPHCRREEAVVCNSPKASPNCPNLSCAGCSPATKWRRCAGPCQIGLGPGCKPDFPGRARCPEEPCLRCWTTRTKAADWGAPSPWNRHLGSGLRAEFKAQGSMTVLRLSTPRPRKGGPSNGAAPALTVR